MCAWDLVLEGFFRYVPQQGPLTGATARTLVPWSGAASAVTCPTVAPGSGTVTPAPAPRVDWSGCHLAAADLSGANLACTIADPRGIEKGTSHSYTITAAEKPGTSFQTAPRLSKAANPETIHFG